MQTILVVDDDISIRALVRIALEDEGYRVVEADNGASALRELDGVPATDLILLDVHMPVMDGWAFSDALKQRAGIPPPIIVFTAAIDSLPRASRIGAKAYLSKPFDLVTLVDLINAHSGRTDHL